MYRRTIRILASYSSNDFSCLAKEIIESLEREKAKNVETTNNRITFTGGVFRPVSNWNVLVPITPGEIEIDGERHCIYYNIRFSQLIIIGSFMVAFIVAAFAVSSGAPKTVLILGLPFIWFWLVGMNLIIDIPRFNRFIIRIIRGAGFTVTKGLTMACSGSAQNRASR
jgi:hypothetical protein